MCPKKESGFTASTFCIDTDEIQNIKIMLFAIFTNKSEIKTGRLNKNWLVNKIKATTANKIRNTIWSFR